MTLEGNLGWEKDVIQDLYSPQDDTSIHSLSFSIIEVVLIIFYEFCTYCTEVVQIWVQCCGMYPCAISKTTCKTLYRVHGKAHVQRKTKKKLLVNIAMGCAHNVSAYCKFPYCTFLGLTRWKNRGQMYNDHCHTQYINELMITLKQLWRFNDISSVPRKPQRIWG